MPNINDSYFDGYYKEVWKTMIPEELTTKEVDFMLSYFNLQPGQKVLDLMCGYGRHVLALSRKGMAVTGIDNLGDYISEIRETADKEKLPVKLVQQNVLDYDIEDDFDLALCMGNSLNFFDAEDTEKLLCNVSDHLKPGGHVLINSWSLAEIAIKNFKERSWMEFGDTRFLTDSQFFFQPTRIETKSIFTFPDNSTEAKTGIDFIFSLNEMESMLKKSGLVLNEVFSIPGKKKFTIGEPRAYLAATKV